MPNQIIGTNPEHGEKINPYPVEISGIKYKGQAIDPSEYTVSATTNQSTVTVDRYEHHDDGLIVFLGGYAEGSSLAVTVTFTHKTNTNDTHTETHTAALHDISILEPFPAVTPSADVINLTLGATYEPSHVDLTNYADWSHNCYLSGGDGVASYESNVLTGKSVGETELRHHINYWNYHRYIGSQRVIVSAPSAQSNWTFSDTHIPDTQVFGDGLEFAQVYFHGIQYNGQAVDMNKISATASTSQTAVGTEVAYDAANRNVIVFLQNADQAQGSSLTVNVTITHQDYPNDPYTAQGTITLIDKNTLTVPEVTGMNLQYVKLLPGESKQLGMPQFADSNYDTTWDLYPEMVNSTVASYDRDNQVLTGHNEGTTRLVYKLIYRNYVVVLGEKEIEVNPWNVNMAFMYEVVYGTAIDSEWYYGGQLHDVYHNGVKLFREDYNLTVTNDAGMTITPTNGEAPSLHLYGAPSGGHGSTMNVTVRLELKDGSSSYQTSCAMKVYDSAQLTVPELSVPTAALNLQMGESVTFDWAVLDQTSSSFGWHVRYEVDDASVVSWSDSTHTIGGLKVGTTNVRFGVQFANYAIMKGSFTVNVAEGNPWNVNMAFMGEAVYGSKVNSFWGGQLHEVYYNDVQLARSEYTVTASVNDSGLTVSPDDGSRPTMYFSGTPACGHGGQVTLTVTVALVSDPAQNYSTSHVIDMYDSDQLPVPTLTVNSTPISLTVGEEKRLEWSVLDDASYTFGWYVRCDSTDSSVIDWMRDINSVKGKNPGTTTLSFSVQFANYIVPSSGTVQVTVVAADSGESGGETGDGEKPDLWSVSCSWPAVSVYGEGVSQRPAGSVYNITYDGVALTGNDFTVSASTDVEGLNVTSYVNGENAVILSFTGDGAADGVNVTVTLTKGEGISCTKSWYIDLQSVSELNIPAFEMGDGQYVFAVDEICAIHHVTVDQTAYPDWQTFCYVEDTSIATMSGDELLGKQEGTTVLRHNLEYWNYVKPLCVDTIIISNSGTVSE